MAQGLLDCPFKPGNDMRALSGVAEPHAHGNSDTWITSFAPSPPTDLIA